MCLWFDAYELSAEDRLAKRNILVRPCVQSFFTWVKQHQNDVPSNSETGKGFTYCLNQEKYLMEFLSDGMLPMDNNVAEQAIKTILRWQEQLEAHRHD